MNAATDGMDTAVFAFCRAVTRAESMVLKVEMTDECKKEIISAREKLIEAESVLLANHRSAMLQQIRNQNEELQSFINLVKECSYHQGCSGGGLVSRMPPHCTLYGIYCNCSFIG